MSELHSGSCLCGGIRFKAHGKLRGIVYCHCSQCRKQSGHFYAATNVQNDAITITGEENIKWYAASEYAARGFCRNCGSVMFWKHHDLDYISVMAGSFDKPTNLQGEVHIFVGDKGDYYEIRDDLPKYVAGGGGIVVAGD